VTPVFNGSTSLRDAAGQMIENVAKSVRRKEKSDDAYLEKLVDDVTALYRLNQLSTASVAGRKDLGPLPKTSVTLLTALCAAWVLIGAYVLVTRLRSKKGKH
jgi:multiple sugar transport system substrate-binding protein